MKSTSTRLLAAVALAAAGSFASPIAFAQGQFTAAAPGDTCAPTGSANNTYASVSCTKGSVTVGLQAWGFTGATLDNTLRTGFQRGSLGDFDANGFGAYTGTNETSTNSHHAFDNVTTGCSGSAPTVSGVTLSGANGGCGGSIEALFLDFGTSKVNLTNVGIGWPDTTDADLSVWAWTGAGTASVSATTAKGSTTTTGTNTAALTGWTLVSNHSFAGDGAQNTNGTLYSSYFMITTYFGAAGGGLTAGDDRFKIDSFTANLCVGTLNGGTSGTGAGGGNGATCNTTVSEPGTLGLAGLAVLGVAATGRRRVIGLVRKA